MEEALVVGRQALQVLAAALGGGHSAVAAALSNVITLLKKQGRDAEVRGAGGRGGGGLRLGWRKRGAPSPHLTCTAGCEVMPFCRTGTA